jgi:hypothetical protein
MVSAVVAVGAAAASVGFVAGLVIGRTRRWRRLTNSRPGYLPRRLP